MTTKSICVLMFALICSTTGFKISSTCVDMCTSLSSLYCVSQCELDIISLASQFGQLLIDKCLKPCHCEEKEVAYPGSEDCEGLQVAIFKQPNCRCIRRKDLKFNTRSLDASVSTNPWENWCKHQCSQGLGGSACYCDIIP